MAEQRHYGAEDLATPGKRIRLMRRSKGWSQQTLASKVYATQPAVSQWENDLWLPAMRTQVLLAEALDCTRHFLFGDPASTSEQVPA
jgi:transcriptional regulator with XRE-family HTH domain